MRVRNAGTQRGREIVQVYASRPDSTVRRPSRWLVGFAAVEADPGEEIAVAVRGFAHWDVRSHVWTIEPGTFHLSAGRSSRDLRHTTEIAVPA